MKKKEKILLPIIPTDESAERLAKIMNSPNPWEWGDFEGDYAVIWQAPMTIRQRILKFFGIR